MPRVLALLLLFACMGEGIAQPVRATDAAMAAQVDAAMALPEALRKALEARKPKPGLTAEERVQRLRELAQTRASAKIFLRADGPIPYARVVQVMGALNAAGFNDIVLVTDTGGPRMDG